MSNAATKDALPSPQSIVEIQERLAQVSDIYARNFNINRTEDWYLLKIQEELGELTSAFLKLSQRGRTQEASTTELQNNLRDELADVLAMTLLFAREMDIDVEDALYQKWLHYLD